MANLQFKHHALRAQQSSVGLGYRDKGDGEIFWEVRNITHKGAREEGKDIANVDGHNSAHYCKHFVEEGLSFGSYLLGVKFAAEDCWLVRDPVAIDQRCHKY